MSGKYKRCADVVTASWNSVREDLAAILDIGIDPAIRADRLESLGQEEDPSLAEYGLCFDYVEEGTFDHQLEAFFRYQFSTGGPGTELRFYVNPSLETCYRIEYWHLDWFDGASFDVTYDMVARAVFDWFNEIDALRHAYEQGME